MEHLHTVSQFEVFKNRKRILNNPLPFHNERFKQYGDTFRVKIGPGNSVIFTRDATAVKHILQKSHKNYGKSSLQTKELAKYIGNGLLTSNGEFWRVHRRMVQPAFHKKKLVGLLGIMHTAIENELKKLKVGVEENVFPLMGDLAFQVVAQSLFSTGDISERMQRLQEITESNQKMLIKEMRQPYLKWWFRISGEIRCHLELSEEAKHLLDTLIQQRIDSQIGKDDLLDMLLKARYGNGTPMSRKQLIDEVLILFTAGHETTANALGFTLLLLAKHPNIQNKLFQEVRTVEFGRDNDMDALASLTYTKQCIEEAMRLYPPVYFIDRVSYGKDKIGKHTFKKGVTWLMSIYELHRHPDFWTNPSTFRPERFDTNHKKDFSSHYFPFGAGPRMCVGNNFAMYEMMMVLANLVKRFRLTTSTAEIEINPLITLKPKEVLIQFASRE